MTTKPASIEQLDTIHLASDIVAAYVANNTLKAGDLPDLLQTVHAAVAGLAGGDPAYGGNREPAVAINKSITPDYIICLEDGQKLKMLKRYLRTHYDLSPEDYRRKWGLPADYPLVAPNYAKRRSQLAKKIGLGTTAGKKKTRTKKRTSGKRRVA